MIDIKETLKDWKIQRNSSQIQAELKEAKARYELLMRTNKRLLTAEQIAERDQLKEIIRVGELLLRLGKTETAPLQDLETKEQTQKVIKISLAEYNEARQEANEQAQIDMQPQYTKLASALRRY